LDSGEVVEARSFDAGILTLLSPRAFAPGSPIRFSFVEEGLERPFEGRTLGSKRVDDLRFEVKMRFVNLRRADRALLHRELP
jgi:hypothetical protein